VKVVECGLEVGEEGICKYQNKRFNPNVKLSRRIYPHVHNMDGFFVAKLRKLEDGIRKTGEQEEELKNEQKEDDSDEEDEAPKKKGAKNGKNAKVNSSAKQSSKKTEKIQKKDQKVVEKNIKQVNSVQHDKKDASEKNTDDKQENKTGGNQGSGVKTKKGKSKKHENKDSETKTPEVKSEKNNHQDSETQINKGKPEKSDKQALESKVNNKKSKQAHNQQSGNGHHEEAVIQKPQNAGKAHKQHTEATEHAETQQQQGQAKKIDKSKPKAQIENEGSATKTEKLLKKRKNPVPDQEPQIAMEK